MSKLVMIETLRCIINDPSLKITEDWRRQFHEFVDIGELGLALDSVEDWIVDRDVRIDRSLFNSMLAVREFTGSERRSEDYIEQHLLS